MTVPWDPTAEVAPDFLPCASCLCSWIFVLCPFQGHDQL